MQTWESSEGLQLLESHSSLYIRCPLCPARTQEARGELGWHTYPTSLLTSHLFLGLSLISSSSLPCMLRQPYSHSLVFFSLYAWNARTHVDSKRQCWNGSTERSDVAHGEDWNSSQTEVSSQQSAATEIDVAIWPYAHSILLTPSWSLYFDRYRITFTVPHSFLHSIYHHHNSAPLLLIS